MRWTHLLASAVAAVVARLGTHPLDSLKVRLQVVEAVDPALSASASTSCSTLYALWRILRLEGIWILYRGLTIALIFSIPALSLYLAVYDVCKAWLATYALHNSLVHLLSGAAAESLSNILWCPMEVIKTQLQTSSMLYQQQQQHHHHHHPNHDDHKANYSPLVDNDNDHHSSTLTSVNFRIVDIDYPQHHQEGEVLVEEDETDEEGRNLIPKVSTSPSHSTQRLHARSRDHQHRDSSPSSSRSHNRSNNMNTASSTSSSSSPILVPTPPTPITTLSTILKIYKAFGLGGFFRGFWVGMLVYIPHSSIYFVIYEIFKRLFVSVGEFGRDVDHLTWSAYLVSSAIAASIASACSNIFDVIKTSYQGIRIDEHVNVHDTNNNSVCTTSPPISLPARNTNDGTTTINTNQSNLHRSSSLIVMASMYKVDGWRLFTRGLTARILFMVPNVIISFTIYESLKQYLEEH